MIYRQHDPWCVQIEPTEGCNLRCGFCGIHGIREKGTKDDLSGPYHFLTLDRARRIANSLRASGWSSRLEFAMHGEPTMNPDLLDIIATFRSALPKQSIQITTNGIPLLDGRWGFPDLHSALGALYAAGANIVALDDYRPHRVAPLIDPDRLPSVIVTRYPEQPDYTPNHRAKPTARHLVIVADISQTDTGTHSELSNHCGAAGPRDPVRNDEVCAMPFRELSIRWDGSVAICCDDWRGEYAVGNASEGVVDLWHSPALYAARRSLLTVGRWDLSPCNGCTARTSRNGLLPDPRAPQLGREALGPVTDVDRKAIAAAHACGPLTPPVTRRWEVPVVLGRKDPT